MVTTELTPELCALEVMETVPLVMRFMRTQMRRHGPPTLSVPQFRVLRCLNRHPGVPLSFVADHLGVTRPTASNIVDRLVRHGLVNRAEDPRERRCVTLSLTDSGLRLLHQVHEATRDDVAGALSGLSPEQLVKVGEGLDLLGGVFGKTPTFSGS